MRPGGTRRHGNGDRRVREAGACLGSLGRLHCFGPPPTFGALETAHTAMASPALSVPRVPFSRRFGLVQTAKCHVSSVVVHFNFDAHWWRFYSVIAPVWTVCSRASHPHCRTRGCGIPETMAAMMTSPRRAVPFRAGIWSSWVGERGWWWKRHGGSAWRRRWQRYRRRPVRTRRHRDI